MIYQSLMFHVILGYIRVIIVKTHNFSTNHVVSQSIFNFINYSLCKMKDRYS